MYVLCNLYSFPSLTLSQETFTDAVKKFHNSGGALYIWGDNDPYYVHANWLLEDMFGIKLQSNTPGSKNLKVGDANKTGEFGRHLITSGVVNLCEGYTISYPNKLGIFEPLATSTDGMKHTATHCHDCLVSLMW